MAQALIKYQGVFGNFPMRLRWLFHGRMLQQSLSFFGDEFAGRISTKVMQTALAVRDTWFIVADILVYVIVYFGTLVGVVASFDTWLIAPLAGWLLLYIGTLVCFVPRLGKGGQTAGRCAQPDDRAASLTPIPTSPPSSFAHGRREASYAREAIQEFMSTVHGQMRLVTGFEIVNTVPGRSRAPRRWVALWLWGAA